IPRVRVPRDHKYWSKLLFIFSSAGKPALPNASRSTTGAAGSLLLIRMMASSPVPGVVGHECDGEVQLFTRSDHYWCARQRQHEYPIGAHQPLHAADDKVGRTDVKNLQSQECRAGANVGEEQEIFEIDRDGGIGGPDELKYPSAVGRRTIPCSRAARSF